VWEDGGGDSASYPIKLPNCLATEPLTSYCGPNLPRYSEDVMKALTISALTKLPLN